MLRSFDQSFWNACHLLKIKSGQICAVPQWDLFPDIFGEKADEAFPLTYFMLLHREHHLDYLVSIDGADAFLSFWPNIKFHAAW